MADPTLQRAIEALWDQRETLSAASGGAAREAVAAVLEALGSGEARSTNG